MVVWFQVCPIVVLRVQLAGTSSPTHFSFASAIPKAPRSEDAHQQKEQKGDESMPGISNEHAADNQRGDEVVDDLHGGRSGLGGALRSR